MDGLEERFLVENRPGRWSSHTGNRYSEDRRGDEPGEGAGADTAASAALHDDAASMTPGGASRELFDLNRALMENDVPETVGDLESSIHPSIHPSIYNCIIVINVMVHASL